MLWIFVHPTKTRKKEEQEIRSCSQTVEKASQNLMLYGTNNRVSFMWLVVMFAVQMAGELLVSPVGLSVSTRLAPLAFQSQMVALWFLADSTSQAVNALITPYFTKDTEVAFFGILGLVCLGIGVLLLLIKKPILNLMRNN